MTTTTERDWASMSLYERVRADYGRAVAEARTKRERDDAAYWRGRVLATLPAVAS
jgi:hypothetical protein